MNPCVIVGANATIGRAVVGGLEGAGLPATDLSGDTATPLSSVIEGARPQWVIHTAGGPGDAAWIEASTADVVDACRRTRSRCCLISSDVVFSGSRAGAYPVDAVPDATHPYGRAKAAAERLVLALPGGLVVRTSLTVTRSLDGPQEQLVARALDGVAISFFSDERRAPLDVDDLARAVTELVSGARSGVYHVVGHHMMSRYELAVVLATAMGRPSAGLRASRSDGSRPRVVELVPSELRTRIRPIDRSWLS